MAGFADFQTNILGPSASMGAGVPSYVPPTLSQDPTYFQNIEQFANPVFGVDTSGLNIRTGLEQPSWLDKLKESLYKGLSGGVSSNPYAAPYGSDALSRGTKAEEQRMAGTRIAEMSDILKAAVAGVLDTKLNTRDPSIYAGYMK